MSSRTISIGTRSQIIWIKYNLPFMYGFKTLVDIRNSVMYIICLPKALPVTDIGDREKYHI